MNPLFLACFSESMVSVLLFLTKASLRPVLQMVTNRNNNNKKNLNHFNSCASSK